MRAGAWTDTEVQTLRMLLDRGMRAPEIARHMRTNYYRIKDKIKTLKDARKVEQRNVQRAHEAGRRHYSVGAEKVERRCLCCGDKFVAEGRYLRLCPTHRNASW